MFKHRLTHDWESHISRDPNLVQQMVENHIYIEGLQPRSTNDWESHIPRDPNLDLGRHFFRSCGYLNYDIEVGKKGINNVKTSSIFIEMTLIVLKCYHLSFKVGYNFLPVPWIKHWRIQGKLLVNKENTKEWFKPEDPIRRIFCLHMSKCPLAYFHS